MIEILYNVMQQPVGYDEKHAACDNPTEREYFCQNDHVQNFIHNATCTFTCRDVQSMLSMAQDAP